MAGLAYGTPGALGFLAVMGGLEKWAPGSLRFLAVASWLKYRTGSDCSSWTGVMRCC